jgi:hypothetical protein
VAAARARSPSAAIRWIADRISTSPVRRLFIQLLKNLRTDIVRLIAGTAAGIGGRIYVKRSIVLRSIKKQGRGASG